MAAERKGGPVNWSLSQDDEGDREYQVTWLVESDRSAGPRQVMLATELPVPGDPWQFAGGPNGTGTIDTDSRATCRRKMGVKRVQEDDQGACWWHVTQTFSTKPSRRCREEDSENPLELADRISVSFSERTEEGVLDKDGERIVNSAHELVRGPLNEWNVTDVEITIEQNRAEHGLEVIVPLSDGLNDREMWGFPPRTIRFKPAGMEKRYYSKEIANETGTGVTYDHCAVYWTRRLTFALRYRWKPQDPLLYGTGTGTGEGVYETWDRYLLDEGTKVIKGDWDTDPDSPTYKGYVPDPTAVASNPKDFKQATDFYGNPIRLILDGHGRPYDSEQATTGTSDDKPGQIFVQYYDEYDLEALLDLPPAIG